MELIFGSDFESKIIKKWVSDFKVCKYVSCRKIVNTVPSILLTAIFETIFYGFTIDVKISRNRIGSSKFSNDEDFLSAKIRERFHSDTSLEVISYRDNTIYQPGVE